MFDVTDEPVTYAGMSREARGWDRAWAEIAKRYGDTVCRCPETGEAWQYMGTTLREGAPVQHCFRHRSLNGQPLSVGVDALPDDLLLPETVVTRPCGEMAVVDGEEAE